MRCTSPSSVGGGHAALAWACMPHKGRKVWVGASGCETRHTEGMRCTSPSSVGGGHAAPAWACTPHKGRSEGVKPCCKAQARPHEVRSQKPYACKARVAAACVWEARSAAARQAVIWRCVLCAASACHALDAPGSRQCHWACLRRLWQHSLLGLPFPSFGLWALGFGLWHAQENASLRSAPPRLRTS